MAKTGEAIVKDEIKKILKEFGCYYFMPVQYGYGSAGLDFHCAVPILDGHIQIAFFIEAKALGEGPTERQSNLLDILGNTFVIDGPIGYKELREWLSNLEQQTIKSLSSHPKMRAYLADLSKSLMPKM